MTNQVDVRVELLALRKGRGVQAVNLLDRLGPRLRELAGIGAADSAAVARTKVVLRVESGIQLLPADLRDGVRAALGIHPDVRQQFLHERLEWFAAHIGREIRTARRRVDEGFLRLAEVLETSSGSGPASTDGSPAADWYVESLHSLVRLDGPVPVAWEERVVVALADGLTELESAVSLGPTPPAEQGGSAESRLEVEVLHGGRLVVREKLSASVFRSVLLLPHPLAAGERHRFGLSITMPAGQPMAPHYVLTPFRRYDSFDLSVRFPRPGGPQQVWRVSAVPPRTLDDPPTGGELVRPDRFGELSLNFTDLRVGLSYGVRWNP